MPTCVTCFWSKGGRRGDMCIMSRATSPNFNSGCSLHRPAESVKTPSGGQPIDYVPPNRDRAVKGKLGHVSAAVRMYNRAKALKKEPNSTELEYRDKYLTQAAVYEGHTFEMANGHKYTPDWIVIEEGEIKEAHEVKGSYAMFSQGRAKLAFDQCRIEFPSVKFVWAKKTKKKGWVVK